MGRHAPAVVILTVAAAALSIAVVLGGPRVGYVPGIVISTVVVLRIVWRYAPPLRIQWLAVLLLASYHGGGTLMVGSDVLAHVSLGVLFGEVVLEDVGWGGPSERSVGSVVIVEVDEPVVGPGALRV